MGTTLFPSGGSAGSNLPANVRELGPGLEVVWHGIELWYTEGRVAYPNAAARHKYDHANGQTVEPTGADPITATIVVEFFGDDWRERKREVLFTARHDPIGELHLPDGLWFPAFCSNIEEQMLPNDEGVVLTFSFEEASDLDWYKSGDLDAVQRAADSLPTSETELADLLAEYQARVSDPEQYTSASMASSLSAFDVAAAARVTTLNSSVLSLDQVTQRDGIVRARYYARAGLPMDA